MEKWRRGKPCLTWKRTLQAELRQNRAAKDKDRWKPVLEGMTRNKKKTRKHTAYDCFHLAKSHPRRTNQNALI